MQGGRGARALGATDACLCAPVQGRHVPSAPRVCREPLGDIQERERGCAARRLGGDIPAPHTRPLQAREAERLAAGRYVRGHSARPSHQREHPQPVLQHDLQPHWGCQCGQRSQVHLRVQLPCGLPSHRTQAVARGARGVPHPGPEPLHQHKADAGPLSARGGAHTSRGRSGGGGAGARLRGDGAGRGGGADGRHQAPSQVPRLPPRALPSLVPAPAARHTALHQPLQLATAALPGPPITRPGAAAAQGRLVPNPLPHSYDPAAGPCGERPAGHFPRRHCPAAQPIPADRVRGAGQRRLGSGYQLPAECGRCDRCHQLLRQRREVPAATAVARAVQPAAARPASRRVRAQLHRGHPQPHLRHSHQRQNRAQRLPHQLRHRAIQHRYWRRRRHRYRQRRRRRRRGEAVKLALASPQSRHQSMRGAPEQRRQRRVPQPLQAGPPLPRRSIQRNVLPGQKDPPWRLHPHHPGRLSDDHPPPRRARPTNTHNHL
mmetsp:Transcript_9745/g.21863  ORF Transcript_9745/g.21863 Transcript_9745/m.21863 type:complete len:490 (+) Transcript_9745:918-2387(+)